MDLKILLPFSIFLEKKDVDRIVIETSAGSHGLLPHRLDCVAALVPGVLVFETRGDGESYVAVDQGILIKAGAQVTVSVRNAVEGTDLAVLHETVDKEFLNLDEQARSIRRAMAKMESGFIRRFMEFHHER
ncbi:MAG TPA: F0F1 ATP synthase subunit epsilon [Nitrosospira sp.]|jgi:F-type H+-transporting ATPase subunit epsilon|nr:F0F1 ATP synthase subunit epsilon [Nitrosospira sp.]